ncbi:MAG: hypothetical protein H0W25_14100 [Acidimicrobiia bacterium]|nr:hypothetical protein [Acidimicrobiia bacterium]
MTDLDGEAWRALGADGSDAGAVVAVAERRRVDGRALLVGITGGVGAGKSTMAEAVVAHSPGGVVVGTDGFLLDNAALEAAGLAARKGFPESVDVAALGSFLAAVAAGGADAVAPVYSHLAYDIDPARTIDAAGAPTVVLEGLHLGHAALAARSHLDLLVHLDAADADLERWYLERFRQLRTAAAADETAFLHPATQAMDGDTLDGLALAVWRDVNLVLLHDVVRPAADAADVVLHLTPDHTVRRADLR